MGSKCKLPVPVYKPDSGYNYYKDLILAWSEVTETPKGSQGIRVALSFNEVDQKLCEKIFTVVKRDVLKKDDGFEKLITFLDKELGKDDLEEIVSIYDDFEDCRKRSGESMNKYISTFDHKSNLLKGKGITLPPEILGFKLLRGAGLTKEERALVLSGIDYEKRESLYEQATKSLKKFKGEGGHSGSSSEFGAGCSSFGGDVTIKTEPAFYTGMRGNFPRTPGAYGQNRPSNRGNYGWRGGRPSVNNPWRGMRHGASGNDSWRGYRGSGMSRGTSYTPSTSWRGSSDNNSGKSWRSGLEGEKPTNKIGMDHQPLQCACCKSIYHFIKDCPDTWESLKKVNLVEEPYNTDEYSANQMYSEEQYDYDQYGNMYSGNVPTHDEYAGQYGNYTGSEGHDHHVVLFTGYNKAEVLQLEVEAHNKAVLDSACSSTVCGKAWLEDFLNSRNPDDKREVERRNSVKTFRFGDDGCLKSEGEYVLPANLVGESVSIVTDVVDSNIPLLLSLKSLKAAGVIINTVDDSAVILGKEVSLGRTSSGHYCIPIVEQEDIDKSVLAVQLEKYTQNNRYKALLKLHRGMGHPSNAKLIALLKDANSWRDVDARVLGEIHEKCDVCKQFARTPSRPVVSLPMASKFNEKVAMDLKAWKQRWILHIIDMWSRYNISVFVSRKLPGTIIDAMIIHWIGYFGVMGTVLTDNGGEFQNEEMRAVCSVLNVEILSTAAESPWQNGLCEKNHQVTDLILHKLVVDFPKIRPEVLLRWANMSKNTLQMWSGYSSNQLVFGVNPNLPNIFDDDVPALEEETMSRTLSEHLDILHGSMKAFNETGGSERIRRCLRNRLRTSQTVFKRGDRVFYKRAEHLMWQGPARIAIQNRKVVFVDHGGYLVKVCPNLLREAPGQYGKGIVKKPDAASCHPLQQKPDDASMSDDDEGVRENKHQERNQRTDDQENTVQEDIAHETDQPLLLQENAVQESNQRTDDQETMDYTADTPSHPTRQSLRVLNKQHGWQVYMVTLPKNRHEDPDCMKAKETELQKLQSFSVYDEVPDCGQTCISTRWVLWNKGNEVRARLVARGFEEDTSRIDVDSPTVGKCTVRMVLAVAASRHWIIKSTDIKSAFLQGNVLQRDVYITPPKEAQVADGFVWKLSRCLYGLNDAARQFYDSVVQELMRLGCGKSGLDPSLFFHHHSGNLTGLMVAHIDDFLHAGDQSFDEGIVKQLSKRFLAGSNLEGEFKYVGYQISQRAHGIVLDQNAYIDSVDLVKMSAEREMQKSDSLNPTELKQYRSIVGSLNWIVQGSRPDLAFQLVEFSTKFRCGTVDDLIKVRKIMQKARECKSEVCFPDLGSMDDWKIVFYSDASHANLCEGVGSCVGYIIFLVGSNGQCCPLTWKSGKARRVVKSTIAAEAMALLDGIDESLYLKKVILQIMSLNQKDLPVIGIVDHKGLWEAVRSTKLVEDRRLRIEIASVKECLQRGEVMEVRLCSTTEMLADCLTKKGADGRKLLAVLQSGTLEFSL